MSALSRIVLISFVLCFLALQLSAETPTGNVLEWGTFRPGRHFGVRAKHKNSPLFGLSWTHASSNHLMSSSIRDECEDRDGLDQFGWQSHNGRDYAKQGWIAMIEGKPYLGKEDDQQTRYSKVLNPPQISTVWHLSTGSDDSEATLTFNEDLFVRGSKNARSSKDDFIQVFGKVTMKEEEEGKKQLYSLVQIQSNDPSATNGDRQSTAVTVRRKRKGKMIDSDMRGQTMVTALTVDEDHKWRTKDTLKSVLNYQMQRLFQAVQGIVKEQAGSDQRRFYSILDSIVPNIKHGYLSTTSDQTKKNRRAQDTTNLALFQQFHSSHFRFFVAMIPDHRRVKSWSDLFVTSNEEDTNLNIPVFSSESDVLRMFEDRQNEFDVRVASHLNFPTNVVSDSQSSVLSSWFPWSSTVSGSSSSKPHTGIDLSYKRVFKLARAAISGVLGGIGYWSGPQVWQFPGESSEKETEVSARFGGGSLTPSMSLFSATPSRSFFPRGFYWDEGFHQLIIAHWDGSMSVNILRSWFDSMNDELGWIPREQIVGAEARSRVPDPFVTQRPNVANPPTLFLALAALGQRNREWCVNGDSGNDDTIATVVSPEGQTISFGQIGTEEEKKKNHTMILRQQWCDLHSDGVSTFIREYFPKFVRHFEWYLDTQSSQFNQDWFRWSGRTDSHNLPSGLDDYPRIPNGVTNENISDAFRSAHDWSDLMHKLNEHVCRMHEGHVDLHAWMVHSYRVLSDLASMIKEEEDLQSGDDSEGSINADLSAALDKAANFEQRAQFLIDIMDEMHWNSESGLYHDWFVNETNSEGLKKKKKNPQKTMVNHKGYVSFFPLFLRLVSPKSPKLRAMITQLKSEDISTNWGIRSLSKADTKYGSEDDYWRGSIWMNLNYLALRSLFYYSRNTDTPIDLRIEISVLYSRLRSGIVMNLELEWRKKGFLFENYNGDDGRGQRNQGFTGWSALVFNIIAEHYS